MFVNLFGNYELKVKSVDQLLAEEILVPNKSTNGYEKNRPYVDKFLGESIHKDIIDEYFGKSFIYGKADIKFGILSFNPRYTTDTIHANWLDVMDFIRNNKVPKEYNVDTLWLEAKCLVNFCRKYNVPCPSADYILFHVFARQNYLEYFDIVLSDNYFKRIIIRLYITFDTHGIKSYNFGLYKTSKVILTISDLELIEEYLYTFNNMFSSMLIKQDDGIITDDIFI